MERRAAVHGPTATSFDFEVSQVSMRVVDPSGAELSGWSAFVRNTDLDYSDSLDPSLRHNDSLSFQPGSSQYVLMGVRSSGGAGTLRLDNGLQAQFWESIRLRDAVGD